MTEKIGLIKNPLTIIAIFAGIAEVSGTVVLPFISEQNQDVFIYFLIIFPSILVLFFFVTLNFNNKVLYAPSDYKDETNYIKINKYDISKQKTIEVQVSKDDAHEQQLILLREKTNSLSSQIKRVEECLIPKIESVSSEEFYIETLDHKLLVSKFEDAELFTKLMKKKCLDFQIYRQDSNYYDSLSEHRAIWLGIEVNLEVAQLIIRESKKFYQHLKYIRLSRENKNQQDNQVYIGGSTRSAVEMFKCTPLKDTDFNKLETFTDLSSFHEFIEQFSK